VSKALEGVVVLDWTTEFWSAVGTALLGDFGAEVIRVEHLPEARARRRDSKASPSPWNCDAELMNRNKLSLALDLEHEEGREILRGLVRQADVFVTDHPLAALDAEGWDYAALCGLQPGLVYARVSGFGPKGPDRDRPALDELAAARTGMMPIRPQPGQPPVFAGEGQMYTSVMLGLGVVIALRHRQETGEGQEVDVSLFAGNMYGASLDLQAYLAIGGERLIQPVDRMDAGNPMSGTLYLAQDGLWVTLTMPDTDRWWPGLAEITGLDPADPRFDSHEKRCEENRLELMRVLEEAFQRQPAAHWRQAFTERQLSADVIEEFSFPAGDEQARLNRYILELEHPSLGRVKTLGFPIYMSDSPARLNRSAPCLGQHTAEILHEKLGYSEGRVCALEASGVIA
jgi:formyl-CoA transferase